MLTHCCTFTHARGKWHVPACHAPGSHQTFQTVPYSQLDDMDFVNSAIDKEYIDELTSQVLIAAEKMR